MLRLAKALMDAGHKVSLFILLSHRIDHDLRLRFAPGVPIHAPRIPGARLWSKVDSLLFKLRIDFSFLRGFYTKSLISYIRGDGIEVLHTHLFTTDIIGAAAAKATGVRAITTIHGDYLFYSSNDGSRQSRIMQFAAKFKSITSAYDAVIVISEEQLDFFKKRLVEFGSDTPLFKIYNGYSPVKAESLTR